MPIDTEYMFTIVQEKYAVGRMWLKENPKMGAFDLVNAREQHAVPRKEGVR